MALSQLQFLVAVLLSAALCCSAQRVFPSTYCANRTAYSVALPFGPTFVPSCSVLALQFRLDSASLLLVIVSDLTSSDYFPFEITLRSRCVSNTSQPFEQSRIVFMGDPSMVSESVSVAQFSLPSGSFELSVALYTIYGDFRARTAAKGFTLQILSSGNLSLCSCDEFARVTAALSNTTTLQPFVTSAAVPLCSLAPLGTFQFSVPHNESTEQVRLLSSDTRVMCSDQFCSLSPSTPLLAPSSFSVTPLVFALPCLDPEQNNPPRWPAVVQLSVPNASVVFRYCHPEDSWQSIGEIWNVETDKPSLLLPDPNTIPFQVQFGNTVYLPPVYVPAGELTISTLRPIPSREGAVRFALDAVACNSSLTIDESTSGKNISLPLAETTYTLCPITQVHYFNFDLAVDSLLNVSIASLSPDVSIVWAVSRDPLPDDPPIDSYSASHVWLAGDRYFLAVRSFSGNDTSSGISSASYTLAIGVTPFSFNPLCDNSTADTPVIVVAPNDSSLVIPVCSATSIPRITVSFSTARLLSPQPGYQTFVDNFDTPPLWMLLSRPSKLRAGNYSLSFRPDIVTPQLNISLGVETTLVEDSFEPNDTPDTASSLSLDELVFANLVPMDNDYWQLQLGNFSTDTDLLNITTNATRIEVLTANGTLLASNCFRCVCQNVSSLCTCGSVGACPPPAVTSSLFRLQPSTSYLIRVRAADSFDLVPETYWLLAQAVKESSLLPPPVDENLFLPPGGICSPAGPVCV